YVRAATRELVLDHAPARVAPTRRGGTEHPLRRRRVADGSFPNMGTGPYAPLDRQQLVCVPGHSSARCCSRVGAVRGVDRSEAMALVCMAAHGRRVLRRRADVAVLASDSPLCAVCKSARRGILRRRVVALYPAS